MTVADDAAVLLAKIGYQDGGDLSATDMVMVAHFANAAEWRIKDNANVTEIPNDPSDADFGLHMIAVEIAVGSFLSMKAETDAESLGSIDTQAAIKSIKEGDTQITYAVDDRQGTALDALIALLTGNLTDRLAHYRRLRW